MAEENPTWATRGSAALEECRPSCWPIDDCAGVESARAFPHAGATDVVADVSAHALGHDRGADFFTTQVWTWRGLVTYYTVFVIDLAGSSIIALVRPDDARWSIRRLGADVAPEGTCTWLG